MNSIFETTLVRGSEEYDLQIDYTIHSWGCGPTAPSFNYPGDPGEPPEYEIRDAWINAPPWSKGVWQYDIIKFPLTDSEMAKLYEFLDDNPPEFPEREYD